MTEKTQSQNNDKESADDIFLVDEHEEEVMEEGKPTRRKGVYILPNLFTTGNLFCGFLAVIMAQRGNFALACILVLVAMVLDGLDGRVARFTNTMSKFGEQYDSMADMVTFGLAPAMISYYWALQGLDNFGLVIAFVYAACAGLRLARFNAQIAVVDSSVFNGLASPAAAAVVITMVWALNDFGISGSTIPVAIMAALVTLASGILMVSNIRYNSFKKLNLSGRVHFISMLVIVLIFAAVFIDPPRTLLVIALLYACSGPLGAIARLRHR